MDKIPFSHSYASMRRMLTKPVLFVLAGYIFFMLIIRMEWPEASLYEKVALRSNEDTYIDPSMAAYNRTLGFGQILYISLPFRSDRQDAMNLLASTTNITLTYQPGVDGKTIVDKAKPIPSSSDMRAEHIGCWRSHADTWRKVMNDDVDTTLILEDDIDWDLNIHEIFAELSRQMRENKMRSTEMTEYEKDNAPYGLDWDIFYVSTCFNAPNGDNLDKHQIYHDRYGPERSQIAENFLGELEQTWRIDVNNNSKRVIAPAWGPVCTTGYAITKRGAQRLLYNVGGYKDISYPVDLEMRNNLISGKLAGYTVIPPFFNAWRTGNGRDSDIDDHGGTEGGLGNDEGVSWNLRQSARKALEGELGSNSVYKKGRRRRDVPGTAK